mgnify:CR=1 FL=1
MSKPTFRVYFVTHDDGRRTGTLMRKVGGNDALGSQRVIRCAN